jgi:hypothetical protein
MANRHLTTDTTGDSFSGREIMNIFKNGRSVSILIFTLILGMMFLLASEDNAAAKENLGQNLFVLGNKAYVEGNYHQAIVHYKAALDKAGYTSSLLYNLGNAYYMKNEIGQSILNYERALYLDPGNAQVKANLALARKNSGLGIREQASWISFFKRLTLNEWTWAGVFALCTFSIILLLNGIRPGILRGTAPKMMGCLCFLLIIAAGTGMVLQSGNLNRGVIVSENTRLRVSPFNSAAESGVVKNGKVVQLAKTYEGYIFIHEAKGQSGWVPEKAVKAILPKAGNRQTQTSLTQSTTGKISGSGVEPGMDKT